MGGQARGQRHQVEAKKSKGWEGGWTEGQKGMTGGGGKRWGIGREDDGQEWRPEVTFVGTKVMGENRR